MKFTTIFLLFIGLNSFITINAQEQKYTSSSAKFTITMPKTFTEKVEEKDFGKQVQVSATTDEAVYMVSYIMHKEILTDDSPLLLKTSLDAFTESIGGSIVSQDDWKVKKHIGILAEIKMTDTESTVKYGVLIANNIQYQVVVLNVTPNFDYKAAKKFIKSFKLTK